MNHVTRTFACGKYLVPTLTAALLSYSPLFLKWWWGRRTPIYNNHIYIYSFINQSVF